MRLKQRNELIGRHLPFVCMSCGKGLRKGATCNDATCVRLRKDNEARWNPKSNRRRTFGERVHDSEGQP